MRKAILLLLLLPAGVSLHAQDYIYFLHNKFLEEAGLNGVHPEYGKCEYNAILDSFTKRGFKVMSELRPKNTDGIAYANKISRKIDNLVTAGVPPSHITVIGTSKGGYIAQYVSDIQKNKDLNFVFIGSCGDYLDDEPDLHYYGNILSIYEKSDEWKSCGQMKEREGNEITRFKEIELNTGMKHGYLYKALPQWIGPAAKWAKQQYD